MIALNIILAVIVFTGIVALLARAIRSSMIHDTVIAPAAEPAAAPAAPRAERPRRSRSLSPARLEA